jgi:hypothetical protein
MRRTMILGVLASLTLVAPAAAHDWDDGYRDGRGWNNSGWDRDGRGWDNNGWNQGGWSDGRFCRRSNGTTGTVIGAAVGGVVGNQVVKGNDRTVATVAGAVVGGLLGRSIDRGRVVCR